MDRFTRNYSLFLGFALLGLLIWVFHENPRVTALNELLAGDTEVANYPYRFRVLRLENGVAIMGTPRSAEFPAFRALGILFPALANREQDDPELMQAQLEMARVQEHARRLVLDSGEVVRVRWELDSNWLTGNGIPPGSW
jgi:hypothetical protein